MVDTGGGGGCVASVGLGFADEGVEVLQSQQRWMVVDTGGGGGGDGSVASVGLGLADEGVEVL